MKLCPYCKSRIIADKSYACLKCDYELHPETSLWDGGFPCGGAGVAVAFNFVQLTVKNEIKTYEGKRGLAIYDYEGRNVGVLYRNRYETKVGKVRYGTYDVEAIFYREWREVFGNNRTISVVSPVLGRVALSRVRLLDYNEIAALVENAGEKKFLFFDLETNGSRSRSFALRERYYNVEVGIFWIAFIDGKAKIICKKGRFRQWDDSRDFRNAEKYFDFVVYAKDHAADWESVAEQFGADGDKYQSNDFFRGYVIFNLKESRHYVFCDNKPGFSRKWWMKLVNQNFDLIDPVAESLWDNFLELSFEVINIAFLAFPAIFSINRGLIESRAQRMAAYFSKTRDEIIKMYKKYPPAMLVTPSDIESALRFKKNKTEDIKSKIFEMPWAIDCITMEKDDEYCGFQSLEQLIEILQFLSFLFGDVISVQKRKFSKNETLKRFVLFKKNEDYYVVCLGMRTPEDKLLRAIFGNFPKIRYAKIARNKKLNLEESYLTIYAGCGKELDNFSKKYQEDKRFVCEVPPLDIFDRLNKCLVLKDGQEQAFARILLLDEKLTEKRNEYVQQLNRDEMTESEWEQREENSINYIFGSLSNFKNYILNN